MCVTAAPARAASTQAAAICSGVTGKAGCRRLNGAFPVTAQVIITFRVPGSMTLTSLSARYARELLRYYGQQQMRGVLRRVINGILRGHPMRALGVVAANIQVPIELGEIAA